MNKNITAVVLIILAIGIYFTVTAPILSGAGKLQAVNGQYVTAIDTAKQMIQLQNQLVTNYNNISAADKDRLSKMLPSSVDNIRLIIDLNNVASQHGLVLQGIAASTAAASTAKTPAPAASGPLPSPGAGGLAGSPAVAISAPTLSTVTVSFTVSAGYLQFISFMKDLEADLRIMDVSNLSMTASDNGQYSFTVSLQTYWLQQQ